MIKRGRDNPFKSDLKRRNFSADRCNRFVSFLPGEIDKRQGAKMTLSSLKSETYVRTERIR